MREIKWLIREIETKIPIDQRQRHSNATRNLKPHYTRVYHNLSTRSGASLHSIAWDIVTNCQKPASQPENKSVLFLAQCNIMFTINHMQWKCNENLDKF